MITPSSSFARTMGIASAVRTCSTALPAIGVLRVSLNVVDVDAAPLEGGAAPVAPRPGAKGCC